MTPEGIEFRVRATSDPDFWSSVGPVLLGLPMRREIGEAPHVESSDSWVVVSRLGCIIAVSCLRAVRDGGLFCHDFVEKEHRGLHIHSRMTELRENEARRLGFRTVRTVASPLAIPTYEHRNFVRTGTRGRFVLLKKELS